MNKPLIVWLRHLTAALLVSGLLVAATPAVGRTDNVCDRLPWWPGCHGTAVMVSSAGGPTV